jgi:hypothetical protein
MAAKPTTAQKIAPYFSSLRERWSKTPNNLHNNKHPEKSITPCSRDLITTNTIHLTLWFFCNNSTKTGKGNLWLTTSHITMTQPIILNLRRCHKSHTQCETMPIPKSRPRSTHRNHLCHKSKNIRNNLKPSPPSTQSSQLPKVPTPI